MSQTIPTSASGPNGQGSFGPNTWLIDEMYEQFKADPTSVAPSWREYFADYKGTQTFASNGGTSNAVQEDTSAAAAPAEVQSVPAAPPTPVVPVAAPVAATPAPEAAKPAAATSAATPGEPLRGVAAKIVANMQASLGVPTATSVRDVPARLLEVNRKILNNHLTRTRGGKVSFTHLIAWAIVEAATEVPSMRNTFQEVDGAPTIHRNDHINLGIAVDLEKPDGSRNLVVPTIKAVDELGFEGFWIAYEDLIRKARNNKLTVEDMSGTTITITNPGGIGTVHSVPRLMPGQAVIVGLGAIDYPAEFAAADPQQLSRLGVSKVVTLTSTYDHRIIQGAESGVFLQHVHQKLAGEGDFYARVFSSLGVPYEPARWQRDISPDDSEDALLTKQMNVTKLIDAYRRFGHEIAATDPLERTQPTLPAELDPITYGLSIWDLERSYLTGGVGGKDRMKVETLLGLLRDAYSRTVGVEYMHIPSVEQQKWFQQKLEGVKTTLDTVTQHHILDRLNAAEAFETFLKTRYVGQKRFGLEGGESAIVAIDTICGAAADAGLDEVVIGMAHRGRLNTLINVVGKGYGELFREFEGYINAQMVQGSGDVKYHLGYAGKFVSRAGNVVGVSMAPNPSHLETVNPVVEGIVRAKQDAQGEAGFASSMPLLIHGDAAFMGQGVVVETLNLSQLAGYKVGGTVHLIINNQIGFTTDPISARSTRYCSDMAKAIGAPIFHVNGDDPEAVLRVAGLAFEYRQEFNADIVIDMVCYRRMGHNEADEPSYTQPQMYHLIDAKRSVRKLYTEVLVKRGDITMEDAERALEDFQAKFQQALDETRQTPAKPLALPPAHQLIGVLPSIDTGVSKEIVEWIAGVTHKWPDDFTIHPKLSKQLETRAKEFAGGEVDWALGEALGLGSLLYEGYNVRVAGQDARRGTFSHRHAVLVDNNNGNTHTPLAHLRDGQGNFHIYDSSLSEYAALGFEYGYSSESDDSLVVWEAQFGDFVNGAQIIIDQYIAAAQDKWNTENGLVMLLPHGYEGQGPEHSSGRIERFLTLCAEDNWQVANCSNAAQYFHILRRQMHKENRMPLVIFTPKSGLRAKTSKSPVADFLSGSTFHEVLDDAGAPPAETVQRLILASGKVAHEAIAKRDETHVPVAVVRLEQFYPWPEQALTEIVAKYSNATEIVWLQEEPENMGAWNFVSDRLRWLPNAPQVRVTSRLESASPASGSAYVHAFEQEDILNRSVMWGF